MTDQTVELPPIPYVNMTRLFALRDKLTSKITKFLGHKLVGENFHSFVDEIVAGLPGPIIRKTIQDSSMSLLNQTLTADDALMFCWRLAGNIDKLKAGKSVKSWLRQKTQEWVLCEIEHVLYQARYKKPGHVLSFRVLTGEPVSLEVLQWWSNRKLGFIATFRNEMDHGLGFSRFRVKNGERVSDFPYEDPRQYYGLRLFMLAMPQQANKDLTLSTAGYNSSTMAYNREIIRRRVRRLPQYACAYGYPTEQSCHVCPYGADKCPAACHAKTYQIGRCARCKESNVFFDPEERDYIDSCVNCCHSLRHG